MADLTFHSLTQLRRTHPAWRLLAAAHAPFVAAFLHRVFVAPNTRTIGLHDLAAKLEDELSHLREDLGPEAFPRSASDYLDEWASDAHGWLRKYYVPGTDEPHFDLTAGTEKAIEWLASLRQRQFVGTESRLLTVFELLRQLVEGTATDPNTRIAELERRRRALDEEIDRIRQGDLQVFDSTQVKDRFQQIASTARGLLADFREVEQNFRELDRSVREKIAASDGAKSKLLEEIFGESDAINDSDQGRSFRAFWDFLMSAARQEELSKLLQSVFELPPVRELVPDRRLLRVHYDWLEAGEVAQRTVARLSDQLRRYLDEQAWAEDRRVMQLIRHIEQSALALRHAPPTGPVMELDEASPQVDLPLDRPLFAPPHKPKIRGDALLEGVADMDSEALHAQFFVDRAELEGRIRRALRTRNQISLTELLEEFPLEKGLSELVAYFKIASEDDQAIIDEATQQSVSWFDRSGAGRHATIPRVLFTRGAHRT